MTFDLEKVLQSKQQQRRRLAARPIGEKLRLLDALRDREMALRASGPARRQSAPVSGRWRTKSK